MPLYRDRTAPIEKRIDDLLGRMTLAEKVGQLVQGDTRDDAVDLVRRHLGSMANFLDIDLAVKLQKIALDENRLGIPLLFEFDAIHGHAFWPGTTVFPVPLALSSAWDPGLMRAVGRVTAKEVAVTGNRHVFSPILCLPRDMRWGRVDETFGEDPHLIGELGAALIAGYQGDGVGGRWSVASTIKHFAGYGETRGGRDGTEGDHGVRKMLGLFLPPFRRAVAQGCWSVMIAYHCIDGVPCITNKWLLTSILKEHWGFRGYTRTDWNNADMLVYQRFICADLAEAYAASLNAGTDVMSCSPRFLDVAPGLVRSGRVSMAVLDAAVRRVLRLKFTLGLFDDRSRCFPDRKAMPRTLRCPAHRTAALQAARKTMVLLKNNGVLPLDPSKLRKIAVVGGNADDMVAHLGDWSFLKNGAWTEWPHEHKRVDVVTLVDGLRALAGRKCRVEYAFGCDAMPEVHLALKHAFNQPTPKRALVKKPSGLDGAVAVAADADVVIAAVGDIITTMGEGRDRATMDLLGDQQRLLERMKALGKPLVVVLLNSKPLTIPWVVDNADAILEAWNPGSEGGTAMAEALFGKVNPSGKLTVSWPRFVGQQPVWYNQAPGWHGQQTYVEMPPDPLFAFGFGLSYTTFAYSRLKVAKKTLGPDDTVDVSVDVKNTGKRAGTEIVQVYTDDLVSSVSTPFKELRAFRRVDLKPGQKKTVKFAIPVEQLALVNADLERAVEPGEFDVLVGPSSRDADLMSTRIRVTRGKVYEKFPKP